jgi:hypothetical protein
MHRVDQGELFVCLSCKWYGRSHRRPVPSWCVRIDRWSAWRLAVVAATLAYAPAKDFNSLKYDDPFALFQPGANVDLVSGSISDHLHRTLCMVESHTSAAKRSNSKSPLAANNIASVEDVEIGVVYHGKITRICKTYMLVALGLHVSGRVCITGTFHQTYRL